MSKLRCCTGIILLSEGHDVLEFGHAFALHLLHLDTIKSLRPPDFSSLRKFRACRFCKTSTSHSNPSQSKLGTSLRGSLRNLTWKTSQTSELGRRVFQRRRPFSKEPLIKEDWSEEFHFITREDIDPSSPPVPSLRVPDHRDIPAPTFAASGGPQKDPPAISYKLLPPLITSDSQINRVSITTSDSDVTPTFAEFAQITASFPKPPDYLPTPLGVRSPCIPPYSTPVEPSTFTIRLHMSMNLKSS
jgi:hypothetical protein